MDDKKITKLKQQAKNDFANKNLDGLIETCKQWLALDPKNTEAYCNRGIAYRNKGEFDNAIADFTKAIELKSDYADAYFNRGNAYDDKGELDKAIANYTKAIELKEDYADAYYNRGVAYYKKSEYDNAIADWAKAIEHKLDDADAYYNLGHAYVKKDELDKAIANFTQAIELKLDHTTAYYNRGVAYYNKGEYDNAIADYTKAIELNPNYADAYNGRGVAYGHKGKFDKAIEDLAQSYKPGISGSGRAIAYIADQIKKTNPQDSFALFKPFCLVFFAIRGIMEKLHLNPDSRQSDSENFSVSHYCSLKTLKSMTKGGRFRFYNVAYMNDPEEGEAFFRMMGDKDKGIRGYFYGDKYDDKGNMPKYQSCYIGSFVADEDRIDFWRTYGKDDGIDAAGCNLIFNKKQFSPDLRQELAGMDIKTTDSKNKLKSDDSKDKRPVLFRVYYENEDKDENIEKLLDELKKIKIEIEKHPAEHKEELKLLACELIDSVRYLFKSKYYANEQEVRIVEYMIPEDKIPEGKIPEGKIKTDDSGEVPKFYIEPYENFRFNEVTLGPKTKDAVALSVWVDKELPSVQVKKSTIPYR